MEFAASVQAVGLRVTKLDAAGVPVVGPTNSYVTRAFTKFGWTPEYENGQEVKTIAADGSICIYYKAPDAFKDCQFQFEICNPQPELTALLAGGTLLGTGTSATITNKALTTNVATITTAAPHGFIAGDSVTITGVGAPFDGTWVLLTGAASAFTFALISANVVSAIDTGVATRVTGSGWAAPLQGTIPVPNGVAIEVWSRAILGGRPAAVNPFWRWVLPYALTKMNGERVLENGAMANVFDGSSLGNVGFGTGPAKDWLFPSTSAIVYARDSAAATAEGYFVVT